MKGENVPTRAKENVPMREMGENALRQGYAPKGEGAEKFHFIFTEITEAFMAATELSISITIYMLFPVILYQIWLFIKPGLYSYERKELKRQYMIYCVLSVINIIATLGIILPATCKFFLGF